jgi:hypothetical protein
MEPCCEVYYQAHGNASLGAWVIYADWPAQLLTRFRKGDVMMDCSDRSLDYGSPGYHECRLAADYFKTRNFKCGWADDCWAFALQFQNGDALPRRLCNVTCMSITIDGQLQPVKIEGWSMSLKDPPETDAVVHWTIVHCAP